VFGSLSTHPSLETWKPACQIRDSQRKSAPPLAGLDRGDAAAVAVIKITPIQVHDGGEVLHQTWWPITIPTPNSTSATPFAPMNAMGFYRLMLIHVPVVKKEAHSLQHITRFI